MLYRKFSDFVHDHQQALLRLIILALALAVALNLFSRDLVDMRSLVVLLFAGGNWENLTVAVIATALLALLAVAARTKHRQANREN